MSSDDSDFFSDDYDDVLSEAMSQALDNAESHRSTQSETGKLAVTSIKNEDLNDLDEIDDDVWSSIIEPTSSSMIEPATKENLVESNNEETSSTLPPNPKRRKIHVEYVAFDFETSGLPKKQGIKVTPKTVKNFDSCRAVSLSAAIFSFFSDGRFKIINTFDALVRPNDFQISEEAMKIHGITQKVAQSEGRSFKKVFSDFIDFIGPRNRLVAHNVFFDKSVLRSEMLRHGLNLSLLKKFEFICTNKMYMKLCNIRNPRRGIRLCDLYRKFYDEDFENAHTSLADSIACGKVYHKLLYRQNGNYE